MKENIKIVTAGAGSGKTYRLATEVLQAIQQKKARPEGILLTTFTRKAAAELEERVRVRLLEQGAWEEAQRVRQAWIGTIDSVCLKIIQEYAFEAGQSPELAVFGAGEDLVEFNRALSDSVTDEELEQLDSLSQTLSIEDWYDRNRDWRSIVKEVADAVPCRQAFSCVLLIASTSSSSSFGPSSERTPTRSAVPSRPISTSSSSPWKASMSVRSSPT